MGFSIQNPLPHRFWKQSMNIKLPQQNTSEREGVVTRGGGVVIASNIKRESEMLDKFGNIIDPRTKQIIKPKSN